MKIKLSLLPLFVAALLVGCGQKSATEGSTTTSGTPTATTASTGSETAGATTGTTDPAPVADLPQELRHSAFEYYGLENTKPVDMVVEFSTQNQTMTGAQTTSFKEMKDGKAIYTIERTGQLANLGRQEVSLEKDGIYVTDSTIAKVDHDLEMPSDLAPGKTWTSRTVVDNPGQKMDVKSTFKVVGTQKVKTKVSERDALLITASGEGTINTDKVRMESQSWYVKGLGAVKSIIKTTYPGGRVETVTIQESK